MRLGPPPIVVVLLIAPALAGCFGGDGGGTTQSAFEPVEASFTITPDHPEVGQEVRFLDTSEGDVASRTWELGDGATGTAPHISHKYSTPGVYLVRLEVRGHDGSADAVEKFVAVGTDAPVGENTFTIDFTADVKGLTVAFTPTIQPSDAEPDKLFWEFGDEAVTQERSPVHTYAEAGTYAVTLRAAKGAEIREVSKNVDVGVGTVEPSSLAARSHAVIAVVDSGINPYHEEFRAAEYDEHPATYIEGYPAEAEPLALTFDLPLMSHMLEADEETWKEVDGRTLYWIPGTRIVGAISMSQDGQRRILDDHGHGTWTASDAAGTTIGTCPTCLIVVVEGLGDESIRWAMSQPWIDIVTNSWGYCSLPGTCDVDPGVHTPINPTDVPASRKAVEEGRTVLYSAGNGMLNAFLVPQPTYTNPQTGPDWIVTVGASEASSGSTVLATGRPVDIVATGLNAKGASATSHTSTVTWDGTSASSPYAAGVFGHVLQRAREALGDTQEGPRGGGIIAEGQPPVEAGANSALADGVLARAEWERAVFVTAARAGSTVGILPPTLPDTPAYYTYAGYGIVGHQTRDDAFDVLLGSKPMPDKSAEDQWASIDSAIRVGLWGPWDAGGGEARSAQEFDDITFEEVDTVDEVHEVLAEAWRDRGYLL